MGKKIVFYHYTTKAAAEAIKKSKVIKKSVKRDGGDDAAYGEGTYGTPLAPENGIKALAQNNYGQVWEQFENKGHLDVAIRLVIDDKNVVHKSDGDREIYLHKDNIFLDECDEVEFIYRTENKVEKYK